MANPKSLDFIEGGETYRAVQIFGEGADGNPALINVSGGGLSSAKLTFIKYAGGGYTYWCEANIGTARSASSWQVVRVTDATGDMIYAGTGLYDQAATDLATVAALTYTLGA